MCLAWTDAPGRSVQNSLSLKLEHPASGSVWTGNADRLTLLRGGTDRENNVQVVRADPPPAGSYVVTIFGTNVPQGSQRFALVLSGALTSKLVSIGRL
jgi:hypothetical protein